MHATETDLRDGRYRRRRHSEEFKAQVVAESGWAGVSVAAIALPYGINANLQRRWVVQAEATGDESPRDTSHSSTVLVAFVPVAIAAHDEKWPCDIEVEIRRGPMQMKVIWPMAASADCGAWLRELLR